MPIITRISTQKKKNRYNIEIDQQFSFGVSDIFLARENLYKGKELSLQQVQKLQQASVEDKFFEKALRFLSYRPRSRRELDLYLKRKFGKCSNSNSISNTNLSSKGIVNGVLSRLENQHYLNDTEFAKWWVEQRTQGRDPKGPRFIKAELYQKGVGREIVDKALSKVNYASLVQKAALKQAKKYKDLDNQAFKRKLSSYLLRRGFLWEDVKPVVDELSR